MTTHELSKDQMEQLKKIETNKKKIENMKTKIETNKKKIENMKTKIEKAAESINMSKGSFAYQTLAKKDFAANEKIRTCHTSGTGRFTKCLDYTDDFRRLLDAAGIAYEYGNDAPRGGKCGQYIILK